MNIWNVFNRFAISDDGETIHKVSEVTSVSSNGTVYTSMGRFTHSSDGSDYTQTGIFSSDGSTKMGSIATGVGAVFIQSRHNVQDASFPRFEHMDWEDPL